jgi:cyclohexa-1,5-dienecarbonyl-CoA hydratase
MIDVVRDGRVVHLVINAPPVNVLDARVLGELTTEIGACATDDGLAAVLLRGDGRCFSAGASVEEHTREKAPAMLGGLLEASAAMAELPMPVVALVHGPCLGGAMELVSCCDFVVADPSAKLGVPEISLAFFPPFACARMPSLSGLQNTAYAVLTGESIEAERALAMGLVQKILPQDEWNQVAELFNRLSVPVLRLAKEALMQAVGGSPRAALEEMKSVFLERLYEIEDVGEGIASFEERRKPEWKHR